jgi:hypothetical protein
MISAHKIQESLSTCRQLHDNEPHRFKEKSTLETLSGQNHYLKRASELLDVATKFDIGEIRLENSQALIDTARECADEGLFGLPFEVTYVEATIVDGPSEMRFGIVFAPVSTCFDDADFEKHPEFLGGTVALNFSRIDEIGTTKGTWGIHTLAAIINSEFTKTWHAFVSNELADNAALTVDQSEDLASISTAILYIMHSLISAKGVEFHTESPPAKLNRKRVQNCRPPLYEHHVLKTGGYASSGRVLGVGATHASPRSHWRRGHIRTIHPGTPKQKRIAIPASLINGPGFVSKEYEVSR